MRENAASLFPGVEILETTLFRVSRNADIAIEEDSDNSIRELVEEQVRQRRFQPVVRLEFAANPSSEIRDSLVGRFELRDGDVYELTDMLDYSGLFELASLPIPELRDPPWTPLPPLGIEADTDIFTAIRAGDVLVHHPYESFDASVERFIRDAADDSATTTIKMTVYRLGDDTPFVRSLIKAAENGKQVACLVELKARFDEERNLHWAEELQKAGDHVIYGFRGLKTHTKLALVVRREGDGLRSYAHIGTGNYHVKTARMYTDFGLFTCDPVLTRDVVNLFHHLTGYSRAPRFEKLLVAPLNMRTRFVDLIGREAANARAGRPARIVAKVNQLEDGPICEALCEASNAGVPIDLIVRGFCCLRPGDRGPDREHPRAFDHRPLPRARPRVPFRQRQRGPARGRLPARFRRLDGPQPVAPGGGHRAGREPAPARAALGRAAGAARRPAQRLADAVRRQLHAPAVQPARSQGRARGHARHADEAHDSSARVAEAVTKGSRAGHRRFTRLPQALRNEASNR